ncbi:MAG: hypothetical protein QOD46_1240 [Actinomycetota bacterium]|nr:hypothetical protein [Actinomycetota bacterium]
MAYELARSYTPRNVKSLRTSRPSSGCKAPPREHAEWTCYTLIEKGSAYRPAATMVWAARRSD